MLRRRRAGCDRAAQLLRGASTSHSWCWSSTPSAYRPRSGTKSPTARRMRSRTSTARSPSTRWSAIAPVTRADDGRPTWPDPEVGRLNSYAPAPCHSNRPRTRSTRTASPSPCTTGAATARRCCSRTRPASTDASGHPSPNDSSDTGATSTPSTSAGTATASAPPLDEENYSWHGFADDARAVTRHLGLAGDPHLLVVRALEGWRGAAARRSGVAAARTRASGPTSRSCSRARRRRRPDEEFGLATSRPTPAQRVAVDRGRVRRRTRRSRR